ncbi:MAG: nitric oxide reductase activation protein [Gammaproteobacteria bacterium]|nr:nitric oxide reductase activation protein [Gammaproteobacteria bacterium]
MTDPSARLSEEAILKILNQLLDPVLSSSRTAHRPAAELATCSAKEQQFALRWLDVVARTNSELGFQFVTHVARAFKAMAFADVESWVVQAMDVYDRQGLYPGSQSLAAIDRFVASQLSAQHAATLDARRSAVLTYYLNGLSSRSLRVEPSAQASTDTKTVFLPEMIDRFESAEKNAALYRLLATQLWAQTYFGTFRRVSAGNATLSSRLDAYDDPEKARRWFERLEQVRLDACIRRTFPGLARQMDDFKDDAHREDEKWGEWIAPLQDPAASVEDTLKLVEHAYQSPMTLPAMTPWSGAIDFLGAERATQARIEKQEKKLREALAQWLELDPVSDDLPDDMTISKAPGDDDKEQVFLINANGESLEPPDEIQEILQSMALDLDPGSISARSGAGTDDHYDPSVQAESRETVSQGNTDPASDVLFYDEWDFRRGHYRKHWCHLKEHDMPAGKSDFFAETLEKHRGSVLSLRRSFEALRNRSQRLRRQNSGDDIDLDALIEARVQAFAGEEMSSDILSRLERRERDIAVIFMVDVSGSTKGWINDAERECLILLCEALEILGDRYAIYGFSGMTRKRCELYRVKEITEPYSEEVKARIAGIEPRDYTRMGVTIRHLTRQLNQVAAKTRLLITLSDGKPDDYDGYRGEYGIEDTRQALIEAKRSGIHPFCITIDQQAREYLPHMYGAVNYTLIDDVGQLPTKVAGIYRQLTV